MVVTRAWAEESAPHAVLLAAWGNAAVCGATSLDEAAAALGPLVHRVADLPGEPGEVALTYALGRLRALGAQRLRAVLPVPGDVAGLPGPADFNAEAVQAGAAVVATGPEAIGLVPAVDRASVRWRAWRVPSAGEGALPDLPQAERELKDAVRTVADELAALDVARWRPELAEALAGVRAGHGPALPPGHPPRAVRVAAQAERMLRVVDLAGADDGAAGSASQMRARTGALAELGRAARRALAVAASGG